MELAPVIEGATAGVVGAVIFGALTWLQRNFNHRLADRRARKSLDRTFDSIGFGGVDENLEIMLTNWTTMPIIVRRSTIICQQRDGTPVRGELLADSKTENGFGDFSVLFDEPKRMLFDSQAVSSVELPDDAVIIPPYSKRVFKTPFIIIERFDITPKSAEFVIETTLPSSKILYDTFSTSENANELIELASRIHETVEKRNKVEHSDAAHDSGTDAKIESVNFSASRDV